MRRTAPVYRWTTNPQTQKRQPVHIGELTQDEMRWEFVYSSEYLAQGKDAWELDPTGIRNKQRAAFTRVGSVPFPVFCDIALQGWALDALKVHATSLLGADALHREEPWGWWERLLLAPADGFGALFVGNLSDKPNVARLLQDALEATSGKLQRLMTPSDSSSGAMGGERPKVAMYAHSDEWTGMRPVMLKFAHAEERADSIVAEATSLTLAAELGLRVPAHEIIWASAPALSIERFDRTNGPDGPVHHCVSAGTALGLTPIADVEDAKRSYVMLRSKLRRKEDAQELYARIVLNAVVGNTDDHPWNTSLRQVGLGDWELSPLYDVLPFFSRQGVPVFRMDITRKRPSRAATRANLLAAGRQIAGLEEPDAWALVERTTTYVRDNWKRVFLKHGGHDAASLSAWAPVFEYGWLPK